MTRAPVEFIDAYLKSAATEMAKPYGVSDATSAVKHPVQKYSKPVPAQAATRPDLAVGQSIQPPPV